MLESIGSSQDLTMKLLPKRFALNSPSLPERHLLGTAPPPAVAIRDSWTHAYEQLMNFEVKQDIFVSLGSGFSKLSNARENCMCGCHIRPRPS